MGCKKLTYRHQTPTLKVVHRSAKPAGKSGAGVYRWGFNGKESDDEVYGAKNFYNYGERMYDPRLGRFPSPDPLIVSAQKYPELSPYQYASNTPIQAKDLDGLEADFKLDRHLFGDKTAMTLSDYRKEEARKTRAQLKTMGSWIYKKFQPGGMEGPADGANTGGYFGGKKGFKRTLQLAKPIAEAAYQIIRRSAETAFFIPIQIIKMVFSPTEPSKTDQPTEESKKRDNEAFMEHYKSKNSEKTAVDVENQYPDLPENIMDGSNNGNQSKGQSSSDNGNNNKNKENDETNGG